MPAYFAETISREARRATMRSPNSGAVTPRANLALTSEATDSLASTAPVPRGTRGVPSRQAGTKAPSSANHLREKATIKASQHVSSVKFALRSGTKGLSLGADSSELQRLRVLPKFLAAKLELKHYLVPITSTVMRRTRHHPVFRFQSLRARRWCQNYLNALMRDLLEPLR